MANVLIMGAGGYLGIPICEELASRGHHVTAIDRWFFGKFPKSVAAIYGDIRDCEKLPLSPDWTVIDLAGLSNDASADIDPELTLDINLRGACRLATVAKNAGVSRYIYSSSCSVYGDGKKHGLTEEDECRPLTLYAECKVQVEDHLRSIADSTFKPVILRNATVFGVAPRMRFDLAVNIMTLRAWRDGRILVMGGGEQWRPFVHIRCVVDAFVWALGLEESDTYNVGWTDQNLSISELARMVKSQLPSAKIENVPDHEDKRSYHVSFQKLNARWPFLPVDRGIAEIVAALNSGEINGDDSTCYTLQYYKSLMEWGKRLKDIRLDGRIL